LGARINWTLPRYKVELTGSQFADMGAPNTEKQVTTDFDVTPLVNSEG